jgi:hypothetical protein
MQADLLSDLQAHGYEYQQAEAIEIKLNRAFVQRFYLCQHVLL